MFYLFYNLIFFLFFIPVALFLFILSLLKGKPVKSVLKRIKYKKNEDYKKNIHFHGVSVGEILSIEKLYKKLTKNNDITISVGTIAGYEVAIKKYNSAKKILFSPFDFPFSVKSFIQSVNPKIFIIAEAEFWFNLYYSLKEQNIPIWIINFRVGNKNSYLKFKFYYKQVFKLVDKFFVPSRDYFDFLKKFGVDEDKIILSGNLKADISYNKIDNNEKQKLISELKIKNGKKIFVAGSTAPTEEEIIFKNIKKYKEQWQFIIAPRHIERTEEVKLLAEKEGLKTELFTNSNKSDYDVLIVDTIGELFKIYSIANLVFVGGSLVPIGGHNILEPIFHSVPTITGKYHKNFKELIDTIQSENGIIIIENGNELLTFFETDEKELEKIALNGKKCLQNMRGAVDKILSELRKRGIE